MVQIKKYRNYTCQFCTVQIRKKNGDFYIETCHIKAKAEGAKDLLNNILVLCPNCHKLFDYGKRKNEMKTTEIYSEKLNGNEYKAALM